MAKCPRCPVTWSQACLGQSAPDVCAKVAAGDADWPPWLARVSRAGDPLDPNNPAYVANKPIVLAQSTVSITIDARTATAPIDPAVLAAVAACPDLGPALSPSELDECGCGGRELYRCSAGRGDAPGRPDRTTMPNCRRCRADHLASQS